MKIVSLTAENFKRLKAIMIKPDGSTVVVGGKNGAGKSSALDAIRAAIGGKRNCPPEPVRRGAKKSEIVLETEEIIVTRKFTQKGTSLEVTSKEGGLFPSPQAMLDKLVGTLSFDPLEFSRMKPVEQAEVVRKLAGLDFEKDDKRRAMLYAERTTINRDLKKAEARLGGMPRVTDVGEEISVADMVKELDRRVVINKNNERARDAYEEAKRRYIEIQERIEALGMELDKAQAAGEALSAKVAKLKDQNTDEIHEAISNAEETNKAVRAAAMAAEISGEVGRLQAASDRSSEMIEKLDAKKAEAIQSAKYPIDGLQVTDDGIELDGLPFEQASSAQRLRCSVAIGLALNPELRVLLVHDGSLLDADSMAIMAKMATDADAQVWIERVGDGGECTVVIEDGLLSSGQ